MACATMPAFAQNTDIKGTVVDENGEPVIGASVRVEGQEGGVITDLDGNYTIKAPKGAKVTITYIGYQPMTVTAGGRVEPRRARSRRLRRAEEGTPDGFCGHSGYGRDTRPHLRRTCKYA